MPGSMRSKKDFDGIHNVLNRLLEHYKLLKPLEEVRLFQSWGEIVGEGIAAHYRPQRMERGTLFVDTIKVKESGANAGPADVDLQEIIALIRQAGIKIPIKKVKII